MENTLQVGDRIAVNKFGALFSDIKRGEVVVFADPDNWLGAAPGDGNKGLAGQVRNVFDHRWCSSRSCKTIFD
jgi:signal peptidase I